MATHIVSELRALPLVRVQRERSLPFQGEVLVNEGARVEVPDIVARANAVDQLSPIPLARYMRLKEDALRKHLEKLPGEYVQARDVIASAPVYMGTLRRIYRAPANGRLASFQGTWITFDLSQEPFQLRALYRGTVLNVLPHRGVVIETTGALAQCVWGIGEAEGALKLMVDTPNSMLLEDRMDSSIKDAVLLAGNGASDAAIARAIEFKAAGLIVGSLAPAQKKLVTAKNFPTLITEGFGDCAMAVSTFQMLESHAGEPVVMNASVSFSQALPEVFIPAKSGGTSTLVGTPPPVLTVHPGARVRILCEPHMGAVGKIVVIHSAPQVMENGLTARGVDIELGANDRVFVPWENFQLVDG